MLGVMLMRNFGFGGMRLPLLDENDPKSIDQNEVNRMVDLFISKGFTYFDNAYIYHSGESESAYKKAIVDRYPRNSFLIADKMPTMAVKCPEDYEKFFARQLERLGIDYFDYYLLHNIGHKTYEESEKWGGFDFLVKKKAEGKIKKIGFSFHDTPELLDEVLTKHPEIDFVQIQLNYIDWNNAAIRSRECLETARKHGKPVSVMEPVKGGGLASLPEKAEKILKKADPKMSIPSWGIRFAASCDGVFMVLSGMKSVEQVRDNTSFMENFKPLTEDEKNMLTGTVTDIISESVYIPCTACRYCTDGCPKNINIPSYFAIYNNYKLYGMRNFPMMHYRKQSFGHGLASDCIECKQCEIHCPQHIEITKYLKEIAADFEK
jgi:predicted aldo/keto reductase-like oxidoreductase